ncbi:DUF6934 family protein [Hymenobacter artigasi]|uniref:Uncharacterized protein n=1 Tax=Hymenobacter artigasi TaxID=2719616 RepID=A0ABX1HGW6_9BACT|nr:hypothetical protein [Hymenobacter artigasi]NKI89442.1 hypothetical protein [Hymenobacter artigasi]
MKLPRYNTKADELQTTFEFISEGPKGRIPKLVQFGETNLKDFYNLAFGDKNLLTGELDDLAVSNNGDSDKVLATVVDTVYAFCYRYPEAWVFAAGSTPARTRLYRMGLNRFYDEAVDTFIVYGLLNDEWEEFRRQVDYTGFAVRLIHPLT